VSNEDPPFFFKDERLAETKAPVATDRGRAARAALRLGAETEHGLMVEYLYGALSMRDPESAAIIVGIAIEEMGHLLTVQNLLLALGDDPYLGRQDEDPHDSDAFRFRFRALDTRTLAAFVAAEAPDPGTLSWRERDELEEIRRHAAVPEATLHPVGKRYLELEMMFRNEFGDLALANRSYLARQADGTEDWAHAGLGRSPIVRAVASWDDASAAVNAIAAQGEGLPHGGAPSHFARFREVYRRIKSAAGRPGAHILLPIPLVRTHERTPASDFFNARYALALHTIDEILAMERGTPARRALIPTLLSEMAFVLSPLGAHIRDVAAGLDGGRPQTPSGEARMPPIYAMPKGFNTEGRRERHENFFRLIAASQSLGESLCKHAPGPSQNLVANIVDTALRLDAERTRVVRRAPATGAHTEAS
jgi:hypothetical protein